jgi:hypothetical protein
MPCSLARKLFEDTERVRDVIVGVLNRVSELQGDHARVLKHTYCSPEFWSYLKYRTRGLGIKIHCVSGRRIRGRLSHQMKRMKFSTPYNLEVVRFETRDHLRILRKLCGETISYGIRGRRPTLKERPIPLGINDTLNNVHTILGDDERDELDEDQAFVRVLNPKHGGIGLSFNMGGDLSIRVSYEKIMYTSAGGELPPHLQNLLTTYQ